MPLASILCQSTAKVGGPKMDTFRSAPTSSRKLNTLLVDKMIKSNDIQIVMGVKIKEVPKPPYDDVDF